jgi:ABC-type multidrug transport system permease subunit
MSQRRPDESEDVSPWQIAVHFAMGALIGTLAALFLVFSDASSIHQLLRAHATPASSIAVFIAFCALTVANGASLTGFIFSAIEAEKVAARQRRRPPHDRT